MKRSSSNRVLLAYYADDFTGSTDALESLARAGLRTVLFLRPPTPAQLAKFPDLRAFGIVGGSRVMSPREMARELPAAFKVLKQSGAAFIHYKTCSTFDSSTVVGSIGKAIEIGRGVFGQQVTPLVVGFPAFGRHVVFGNLFARSGESEIFRLDRHPMSRHPVTPMNEADLRLHLCRQTRLSIELVDILDLKSCQQGGTAGLKAIQKRMSVSSSRKTPPILLFDTLESDDLPIIGNLIAGIQNGRKQLFCAGSSGIGYALTSHWQASGTIKAPASPALQIPGKKQLIVISGSCSPVTARQIKRALKSRFAEVACDARSLADPDHFEAAIDGALSSASRALDAGQHIILHSSRGDADPRRREFEGAARSARGRTWWQKVAAARATLGNSMGRILERVLKQTGASRVVICGGDTATAVGRALGIQALEFLAPATTGAPWCRVHAPGEVVDGCQLICKGGQVGADDFLVKLAEGKR